jgi:hypothetical protein
VVIVYLVFRTPRVSSVQHLPTRRELTALVPRYAVLRRRVIARPFLDAPRWKLPRPRVYGPTGCFGSSCGRCKRYWLRGVVIVVIVILVVYVL